MIMIFLYMELVTTMVVIVVHQGSSCFREMSDFCLSFINLLLARLVELETIDIIIVYQDTCKSCSREMSDVLPQVHKCYTVNVLTI